MDEDSFLIVFIIFILALIIVILVILFVQQGVTLISPSKCPTVKSDYGVIAGRDGRAINTCGPQNNASCTFTEMTLVDAINECNLRSNQCSMFIYDDVGNKMKIV